MLQIIPSLILFITYLYGLGYIFTRSQREYNFETCVMRLGLGLGVLPVLGVLMNMLRIPLDWKLFLAISLVAPIYDIVTRMHKGSQKKRFKLNVHTAALVIIFLCCVAVYCGGPFVYPWLENDDSWFHAAGIKYIAVEKNLNAPSGEFQYINPYPPGYDLVLALIHQTTPSLYVALKFFNGFIISLGFLFFYYFVKEFSGNKTKAFYATFFLACIPCYLSHFIWAHSLAITLFFPALYWLLKSRHDKKCVLPASIVMAAIFMTQPTQSLKFLILVMLYSGVVITSEKKFPSRISLAVVLAVLISCLWWVPTAINITTGKTTVITTTHAHQLTSSKNILDQTKQLFNPKGGSATRTYSINDFLIPPKPNRINNPIGVSLILSVLSLLGICCAYKNLFDKNVQERHYSATILLWLLFTWLGVNSMTFSLPVGLFAFRFWMLLAILISILAAETVFRIRTVVDNALWQRIAAAIVFIAVIIGPLSDKIRINTSLWPWGIFWNSGHEIRAYSFLRENLAPDTKVFTFTDNLYVIGWDMRADYWQSQYKRLFNNAITLGPKRLHNALTEFGFQYIIISEREKARFGAEVTLKKVRSLEEHGDLFGPIMNTNDDAWIFKVL